MSKYRPKIQLFLPKKYKTFERWGLRSQYPCLRPLKALFFNLQSSANGGCVPDTRNILPSDISGCASESNHVFALLISVLCFKSINFYQNKLKIKLFLQNNLNFLSAGGSALRPPKPPFPHSRFFGYVSVTRRMLLILPSFIILQ